VPVCSSCGTENPEIARFCLACGTALADAEVTARQEEERRPITAVFVDMVGSTSRAEQLDPEDVLALLAPYYERLRAVLERHEGVVEKFIGDAVVALFGAPVAHEDDPERAVRAGLGILEEIAKLNADDPARELSVRVGITTGEAIVSLDARLKEGRGMAWGDVLNTAARLQSAAPVDGVLVDERTYRACRGRIRFRPHDEVVAKGKASRIAVWEAVSVDEDALDEAATSPLVGRHAELERLLALSSAVDEQRRAGFALVTGEPGLGKSRLIAEVARRTDGATVLSGACLSYGEGITYWPIAAIVRSAAGILVSDDRSVVADKLDALIEKLPTRDVDHLRTIASALANLIGAETTPRGTYTTGELSRAELHWGVRRALELLAAERPLIVVLEDIHWAEPSLVDLVESILESEAPMLVVASARPEVGDAHPRLVQPGPLRKLVQLEALGQEESEALVAVLLQTLSGRRAEPRVVQRLAANARGNPLFLEETARMLVDAGRLDEASVELLPVPDSVQALVGARLDALPAAERQLAQHAAVAGTVFWSSGAHQLVGGIHDPSELLESLQRRGFVRETIPSSITGDREWEFKHILIRDVAYGRLPKARRVGLHVRFANWIGGRAVAAEENVEILAYHLERACLLSREVGQTDVPPPLERAIDALGRAGEKAARREGAREAHRYYARALDLAGDDAARALPLRLGQTRALVSLAELRRAAEELTAISDEARALRRLDVLCEALVALANVDTRLGNAGSARERLTEAEAIALELADLRLQVRSAYEATWAEAWFGADVDGPIERLRASIAVAEELGDVHLQAEGYLRTGMLLMNAARLVEAESPLRRAAALAAETGSVRDDARATHNLGLIAYYGGRLDDAERVLLQAQEWLDRTDDSLFQVQNQRALGLVALARDDPQLAEERLRSAMPLALEHGGWLAAAVGQTLVDALLREGRDADARLLADTIVGGAGNEDPRAHATTRLIAGRLAGLAGDLHAARVAHNDAIETLEEIEAWIDLAEAQLSLAATLRDAGEDDAARGELERARKMFVSIGAAGQVAQIDRELEDSRRGKARLTGD
jgi:class 3 adenylate cyclase/tetratricopeptide (TPR) repeat protein